MSEILIYLALNAVHFVLFLLSFLVLPAFLFWVAVQIWLDFGHRGVPQILLCLLATTIITPIALGFMTWVWPFGQEPKEPHESFVAYAWQHSIISFDDYRAYKKRREPPSVVWEERSVRRYKIIDWKPPMYARVSLKDVQTGVEFRDYTVGKYCNAKAPPLGAQVNLDVREYRMSDDAPQTIRTQFLDLRTPFCTDL